MNARIAAFSLVELSIVLVILGLLTGGILTGQELIRASELRAVTTEFSSYQTAVNTFKNKYFGLPGDINNAEDFWGTMTNCGAASPSGTGTQTCNGDRDNDIDENAASQTAEIYMFWQHLSNAGLIEGTYTGITSSGGVFDAEIDINVPSSKISGTGWSTFDSYTASGDANYTDNVYNKVLSFGADTANEDTYGPALTPEEAWNIDTKLDDGLPQRGKIWAVNWDTCTNAANAAATNGTYLLTDSSVQCALAFVESY